MFPILQLKYFPDSIPVRRCFNTFIYVFATFYSSKEMNNKRHLFKSHQLKIYWRLHLHKSNLWNRNAWWKNSMMEPPMERLLWLEFFKKPFPHEDYRNSPTCEIHVLHPSKASFKSYSKCCCIYKRKPCTFVINHFITNYHTHIGLNQSTVMIP